jgi:hypothetical protein
MLPKFISFIPDNSQLINNPQTQCQFVSCTIGIHSIQTTAVTRLAVQTVSTLKSLQPAVIFHRGIQYLRHYTVCSLLHRSITHTISDFQSVEMFYSCWLTNISYTICRHTRYLFTYKFHTCTLKAISNKH